ncbi:MAG: TrbG/VirB9 family P-type conjugative transfer protein [Proteobacteria bacterium]|nr:TrbG/VirB9 family P-type conjugative transfer protein [Pseudomonadota bacterium]
MSLSRVLPGVLLLLGSAVAAAEGVADPRLRTLVWAPDEVYRLEGYAGWQIDVEFEPGERFVGLGAGDLDSLAYAAQDNHLFIKPKAAPVATNLTVITDRRTYHFDYRAALRRPHTMEVVYAVRFVYAAPPSPEPPAAHLEEQLVRAADTRPHNLAYAYCGPAALKPESAWDDGVQTHVRFGARQELPAVFLFNEDGSESLVNFTVVADELVLHRVARRFVVRRGALTGCIVNQRFAGGGAALGSGTVTPAVRRLQREVRP